MPDISSFYPPNSSSHIGSNEYDPPCWTFAAVQERLVEAYGFLQRLPDRDRGRLRHATMTIWRLAHPTAGMNAAEQMDYWRYQASEPPRLPGLTREEVARMEEALGWVEWVEQGEPRRIVGLAISQLASGRRTRVAWGSLVSDPTVSGSADRMRKSYGRAVTVICNRLNTASELG